MLKAKGKTRNAERKTLTVFKLGEMRRGQEFRKLGDLPIVPGGIPRIYLRFRWTCNVCVAANLGVKTIHILRIRENKLLIPK